MASTPQEHELVEAVRELDATLQAQIAAHFSAKVFDISLVSTAGDREKLRDWVESKINKAPGHDLPRGLAKLRSAIRALRLAMGDAVEGG